MLLDPDNFRSAIDIDDEVAAETARLREEEDERLARELDRENRRAEEERQRMKHEEERRRARAEQERRKRELEMENMREEVKKRQREESASVAVVQRTTKPCPGCQWPIEKNRGCAHMTCKCFKSVLYVLLLLLFSSNVLG